MLSPASPPSQEDWNRIDARVARSDEDRWLSSRYAAQTERRALIALYALNLELARVRLVVSEPTLGAIRFQWWREALGEIGAGGPVRKHDVVQVLASCIQKGAYSVKALQRLVDGHEAAFEAGDRNLEPEAMLMAMAAHMFARTHGWGRHIQALAPAYARARRGESQAFGPVIPRVPSEIRPALAHARLRGLYSQGKLPGRLMRRWVILRAMMTGRV
ncbi:MAG: squalene/phytoene synthase family protein [Hyphomonadaceae bacterium]|nr:squalene/phytoene synthase family protein [Hyphomonadaceae bacterium]